MLWPGDRVKPYHHRHSPPIIPLVGTVRSVYKGDGWRVVVDWDGVCNNPFHYPESQLIVAEENTMFKAGDKVVSKENQNMVGVVETTNLDGLCVMVRWDGKGITNWVDSFRLIYLNPPYTKFWVVWAPAASNPTVKHESEDSARHEAERLSKKHPGREFHVLKCIGSVKTENNPTTEWT